MVHCKQRIGKNGEDMAISYLQSRGYKIIERNYKTKFGEIDIIAADGEYIVFVEVKKRFSKEYGPPELSITRSKRLHIAKSALSYIKLKKLINRPVRFDVIALTAEKIELIKNAFDIPNRFFY